MDLPPYLEAGPLYSGDQIAAIERAIGEQLPDAYKDFVTSHGGVLVTEEFDEWRYVHVDWRRIDGDALDPEDAEEFETTFLFYGLWEAESALEEYQNLHIGDETLLTIPRHYFPIAHDTGGANYWLDLSDEGAGSVWLIYPNTNVAWGDEGNDHIGFVASDFEDLITSKLQDPPPDW